MESTFVDKNPATLVVTKDGKDMIVINSADAEQWAANGYKPAAASKAASKPKKAEAVAAQEPVEEKAVEAAPEPQSATDEQEAPALPVKRRRRKVEG